MIFRLKGGGPILSVPLKMIDATVLQAKKWRRSYLRITIIHGANGTPDDCS